MQSIVETEESSEKITKSIDNKQVVELAPEKTDEQNKNKDSANQGGKDALKLPNNQKKLSDKHLTTLNLNQQVHRVEGKSLLKLGLSPGLKLTGLQSNKLLANKQLKSEENQKMYE